MIPKKILQKGKEAEFVEHVAFTITEAEFDASSGDSASPAPGDPCDYQGQTGTLTLLNGALVCSIGGQPPVGSDGAN